MSMVNVIPCVPSHSSSWPARIAVSAWSVSSSYLSQIETGTREVGIDTLKRIATILRVSIDDLV